MELDEDVVDEVVHQGPASVRRTVLLLERGHRRESGVERGVLDDYVEAFDEHRSFDFDPEWFYTELEEALVDAESWADEASLYCIGENRISRYPQRWHDELGGSGDVAEFVRLLSDTGFTDSVGASGAGQGVDEQALLDAVAAVGRVPKEEAKASLETLRDEGVVVEDADQHPHAGVYLAANASELRDPALDDS